MRHLGFLAAGCVLWSLASGDTLVGRVPGEFAVSGFGDANYRIPIEVAGGINDLKPSLSLMYSSAGGDGPVGIGWAIGGLSSITLCPRTLSQDEIVQGVRYEPGDAFCLDGQRLVLISGSYGLPFSVYKTELDQNYRISILGQGGPTELPQSFVVKRPNGLWYYYGTETDSRILAPNTTGGVRAWALARIQDRYQNRVVFHYGQDATTGESWPTEVRWTQRSGQSEADARYRIRFTYQPVPRFDSRSGYMFGSPWARTKLLQTIEYEANSGAGLAPVHTYTLEYQPNGTRSRLQSVNLTGPTHQLPTTQFLWRPDANGFVTSITQGPINSGYEKAGYGDFDNDGDTDVFMSGKVMLSEVVNGSCCAYTAPQATNYITPQPSNPPVVVMELNGDGRAEPIGWKNNGGLTNFSEVNIPPLTNFQVTDRIPIDIDGDGLDELMAVGRLTFSPAVDALFIWRNIGGVLQAPWPAFTLGPDSAFGDIQQIRSADFDGDGRQDILLRESGFVWHAYRSDTQANGSDPNFTDYGSSAGYATGEFAVTADVNGDGLTDVLVLGGSIVQPATIKVAVSRGKHGPGPGESLFAGAVATEIKPGLQLLTRVVDFDGDGRDDILTYNGDGSDRPCPSTAHFWCVWKSNGASYLASNVEDLVGPDAHWVGSTWPAVAIVDINADGYRDLLVGSNIANSWTFRLHQGPRANLITNISDGLGNDTEITYRTLSSVANDGSATAPRTRLARDSRPVVEQYESDNGLGGTYATVYEYSGALRDMWGRGFLGFSSVKVSDNRPNKPDLKIEYSQSFPYVGRVEKETLLRPGTSIPVRIVDPVWAEHLTDPDSNPDTLNAHAVRPNSIRTDEYEVDANGSLFRTTLEQVVQWNTTHNAADVVKAEVSSPQQAGVIYRTTTTNYFDPAPVGVWCLGLPAQIDTLRENGSDSRTRRELLSWDPSTCRQTSQTIGATGPATEQLKTTTQYDQFGRISWVTLDNASETLGLANEDRKVQLLYDDAGEDARPYQEKAWISGEDPHVVQRTWHVGFGLPLTETDVRDQVTVWTYDEFGRPKTEARPEGVTLTLGYASCSVQDAGCFAANARYRVIGSETDGFWRQTDFDQMGRPVGEAEVLGDNRVSRHQTTYNALGQVIESTIPAIGAVSSQKVSFTYDLLGRQKTEVVPTETSTSTSIITRSGLVVAARDGNTNTTTRTFNPDGTLAQVLDALGKTTSYQYTAFGELKRIDDAGNNATIMTYDDRGLQRTLDDPDSSGVWYTNYNVFGEVWRTRDPKTADPDWTMTITYDQLGRPKQRIEAEGTTNWVYHTANTATDKAKGLLKTVTGPLDGNPSGYQEEHWYNAKGLERQTRVTINGGGHFTNMTYNAAGRLETMTYPQTTLANRHTYAWNYTNGYTSQVSEATLPIWTLHASDALGRHEHVKFGLGTTVYDERRITSPASTRLTGIQTGQSLGTGSQNYSYSWDNAGNLVERKNLAPGGKTEGFAYDSLNRLQAATLDTTQTLDVDYDDSMGNTGNIKYKSDFGTYTYGLWGAGPRQVSQVSGAESMTYHYDANGNMDCRGWNIASQACTPAGTADEIQWTSFNLPTRIERGSSYAAIAYGPDRQRVREVRFANGSSTMTEVVGPHFQMEASADMTRFRNNVLVDGQIVYFQVDDEIPGDGHSATTYPTYAYYVHRDHQGSIDEITHAWGTSGAPVPYSYDAFGKRREPDWTADADESQLYLTGHMATRGYTGHEHLDALGLIHMNGRVQDPILGRMISRDPVLGDISNPETLNRYSYVGNNPGTNADPTGYWFSSCDVNPQCTTYEPGFWQNGTYIDTQGGAHDLGRHFVFDPNAAAQLSRVSGPESGGASASAAGATTGVLVYSGGELLQNGLARGEYAREVGALNGLLDSASRELAKDRARQRMTPAGLEILDRYSPRRTARSGSVDGANRSNEKLNRMGRSFVVVGRVNLAAAVAVHGYRISTSGNKVRQTAQAIGGGVGAVSGGLFLGSLGSVISPGPGTVIGGLAGAGLGGAAGENVAGSLYDIWVAR